MIHLAFLIALYFLPTIIAGSRDVYHRPAIFFVNLFFGWTFIGWIVALIWAIASPPAHFYYGHPQYPPYPPYPPATPYDYPPYYRPTRFL
jgi:hypothetical protein